jgi:hypothetical protein
MVFCFIFAKYKENRFRYQPESGYKYIKPQYCSTGADVCDETDESASATKSRRVRNVADEVVIVYSESMMDITENY